MSGRVVTVFHGSDASAYVRRAGSHAYAHLFAAGYLVPEGDVRALAARLEQLSRNFTTSQRVCSAARRLIVQRHDIDRLNDRLVRHFEALMTDSPLLSVVPA